MAASRLLSITEKIIKPSSPTPNPLRHHKLSLLDQVMGSFYVPMSFFYSKPTEGNNKLARTQVSQLLENSLAKTLAAYYPFAGKLKDHLYIDCNDTGAKFLNVELNCSMSEVVNLPDTGPEYLTFPKNMPWSTTNDGNLVVAQLSHFKCGGIAVSGCLSHKLGDACTAANFMNHWATIARGSSIAESSPQWNCASIFPPTNDPSAIPSSTPFELGTHYITKRYGFSSTKLNALKKQLASESRLKNLTRNEVVTALLYKCAMDASRTTRSGLFKPSGLYQMVNLRPRLIPPLPQTSVGNILSAITMTTTNEEQTNLASVVRQLRMEKKELKKKHHLKQNGLLSALQYYDKSPAEPSDYTDNMDMFWFSSLSNYPLYNTDFGWGRPERAIIATGGLNTFIMMDNRDGDGMEAVVSLGKEVMGEFHNSKELLEFASPVHD